MSYFIDSHCHMFTIADVPLRKAIGQAVDKIDAPLNYLAFPLAPFIRPFYNPKKAVEHYDRYISFFESEPEEVVKRLCDEVAQTVATAESLDPVDSIILTPLIMDFDAGSGVSKLRGQARRLKNAISTATTAATFPQKVKILPFLGLTPGRSDIDQLLSAEDGYDVRSIASRGGLDKVSNGDVIGVKLYPPLGFDVYPEKFGDMKSRHMDFYRKLAQSGLPVTVHCQKNSFSLIDSDIKDDCTSPMNWEAVFNELSDAEKNSFRINFAHFGGDDGIYETVKFRDALESDYVLVKQVQNGINHNTWTHSIIRLLKKYPHTYSDIAAFSYKEEALVSLLWIIYLDRIGKFDSLGPYKLFDKLLWGSDYPMILNADVPNYQKAFKKFADAFTFAPKSTGEWEHPPIQKLSEDNRLSQKTFVKALVYDNPLRFLAG